MHVPGPLPRARSQVWFKLRTQFPAKDHPLYWVLHAYFASHPLVFREHIPMTTACFQMALCYAQMSMASRHSAIHTFKTTPSFFAGE